MSPFVLRYNFVLIIGPLMIRDLKSGIHTVIGVATDAPYTIEQYKQGPVNTFSRVAGVLPWIDHVLHGSENGL